ncbi:MAG: cyclic lactone autoinducer peptide [Oscillospiraceae bacterium]|nr:cyclic lactone autoinducer peptide [Oscillospiraceae bacterium]
MFKKLFKILLVFSSSLALLIATASVAGACFFLFHQPDIPETLNESKH